MIADKTDTPLLSAIYIIDELWTLDCVPWRESINSTLNFVDELIVVHGGKCNIKGEQPTLEYLQSLGDPRIQIHHFPWPENFDWRQIGRSCAYGQLHARGKWCMRVLTDEVFADDFSRIRNVLSNAKDSLRMVLVDRLYLLGYAFAFPYHIQLIFKNDKTLGFGTINPAQGGEAMPGLFDGPIETDLWFDGQKVVSISEGSILRDPRGAERLIAGETPRGYRPADLRNATYERLGIFNVDVNYFTDEQIIRQKETSHGGYDRLPKEYFFRIFPKGSAILETLTRKQQTMAENRRLRRVKIPSALMAFHKEHCNVCNPTSRTCSNYALPWDDKYPEPSIFKRRMKISVERLRRFIWSSETKT